MIMSCSILTTNFDAVALLRYGRFDESVLMLRAALSTISVSRSAAVNETATEVTPSIMSLPIEDSCNSNNSNNNISPDSTYSHMFARGFVFEGTSSIPNTDRNAALCAVVCLYNMALSFHVKGLKHGGSHLIAKAAELYQKVYYLLSTYQLQSGDSVCSLLLATVLNLIAAESELLGDVPTSPWKSVYNKLYALLLYGTDRPVIFENPEEFSFFATCAIVFDNEKHTSAAAA
jgi:hypothetical protein